MGIAAVPPSLPTRRRCRTGGQTMPRQADDLLSRPCDEAARALALRFLDEASVARERLQDPHDTEALHDCRVGLRRLRSCLRAYDACLGARISRKMRRRLRDIAASTNAGRDAEV